MSFYKRMCIKSFHFSGGEALNNVFVKRMFYASNNMFWNTTPKTVAVFIDNRL